MRKDAALTGGNAGNQSRRWFTHLMEARSVPVTHTVAEPYRLMWPYVLGKRVWERVLVSEIKLDLRGAANSLPGGSIPHVDLITEVSRIRLVGPVR